MLFLTISDVVKPAKAFLRWHLSLLICAFFQATNWQIDSFVRHFFYYSHCCSTKAARTRRQPNDESFQMTRHILSQLYEFIAIQYPSNYKHLPIFGGSIKKFCKKIWKSFMRRIFDYFDYPVARLIVTYKTVWRLNLKTNSTFVLG